jgi:phosphoglycolate phosphatase
MTAEGRHPYDLVIFDFDGTLADSAPWFRSRLNQVAQRFHFRQVSDAEFEALRGRPTTEIIRYLGVPAWRLPLIARHMRRLYAQDASQIALFEGVDRLLATVAEAGIASAIVSSNAQANVRGILGEANAMRIRHYSCGVSLFGKAARFRAVIRAAGARLERTLGVGDEVRDLEAARAVGIAVGAVGWGYAAAALLRAWQPNHLFTSMAELSTTLTGLAEITR